MKLSWNDDTSATITSTSVSTASISGRPDVARRDRGDARRREHRRDERRDGGLAVGAGDADERDPRRVGPFGREVDLRADVDPEVAGGRERWMVLGYARARHDAAPGPPAGRQGRRARAARPRRCRSPGRPRPRSAYPAPPGRSSTTMHVVAGGVEPADDRLAGHAEAEHDDARAISRCPGDADEVGVEDPEPERDAEPGEEPEPHDDRELRPAADLEVVVDRRHAQHPPAEAPERDDLGDDARASRARRARRGSAGAGRVASGSASPRHRAAERERAGVAHEDPRGRSVPPQEPRARAHERGGDDRQVERVGA